MINPSDTSALTFQTESPLSKLVEHCNKFGHDSKGKFEKLENAKVTTTESLLLPADMNPYAQYHPFIPTTNWWVEQNWQLYPTTTTSATDLPYQSYLSNQLLLGGGATSANIAATSVNLAAAAVATSSVVPRATGKSKASSSSSSSSTSVGGGGGNNGGASNGGNGGGKYQARSNCECPNCQELERVGVNNLAARKRGVHNCHIAGCGKVYNKSSHLKAHLRWHSGERPSRTNKVKNETSEGLATIYQ